MSFDQIPSTVDVSSGALEGLVCRRGIFDGCAYYECGGDGEKDGGELRGEMRKIACELQQTMRL